MSSIMDSTKPPKKAGSKPSVISFGKSRTSSKGKVGQIQSKQVLNLRRYPYKVLLDGVDVTPIPLMEDVTIASAVLNAAQAVTTDAAMQDMADYVEMQERTGLLTMSPQMSNIMQATVGAVAGIPSLTAVARLDDTYIEKSSSAVSWHDITKSAEEKERPKPDTPVSFIFKETEYFELFELPSETVLLTDTNYENILQDRALFTALTSAIKTRADADSQTMDIWVRTKFTQRSGKQRRHQQTMVTYWNIYDTENSSRATSEDTRSAKLKRRAIRKMANEAANASGTKLGLQVGTTASETSASAELSEDKAISVVTDINSALSTHSSYYTQRMIDKKANITFGNELKFAGMIIERLLQEQKEAANQMAFCGLPPQDRFQPDIRYLYEINILWTFEANCCTGRCVTCISWSENPLILAVGYGRYSFTTASENGVVCVWNIKNPAMPERIIRTSSPVTACAFSKRHPNLLAVGQINGGMALFDISTHESTFIFQSPETGEPIWSITWLQMESDGEDEMLLAGTQDGRILRYRRAEQFKSVQMMRVARTHGQIRGITRVSTQVPTVICSQYAAVLTLCECPTEADGYLAGTDDGCIHLCSAHYIHRHLGASACHVGPVYRCQVSPFIDKIYLTCGADWSIRFWAQGIHDPILTFSSSAQAVEGAEWCPVDSCLVASISGPVVSVWDLRRKIIAPAGTAHNPDNDTFSVVTWSRQGALIVGDRAGRIRILKIEGQPLRPFFQQHTLANSLRKALRATKPELYAALKRLGGPF